MVEWLRSEVGGLLIAAFGYLLRELSENQSIPGRFIAVGYGRLFLRLLLAVIGGAVALAMMPEGLPNYARVGLLVFVGAATPEIVKLLLVRGMSRLDRITKDKDDAR